MIKTIILGALVAMTGVLSSCEQTSTDYKKSGRKSHTKELIEQNIDMMGTQRWNRKTYLDILNNQIENYNGNSRAVEALKKKLNKVYCRVLMTEGYLVMENECLDGHSILDTVIKELTAHPEAEYLGDSLTQLNAAYALHQDAFRFSNQLYAKQKLKTLSDPYDKGFETKMKKEAEEWKKRGIKCRQINNALNGTSSIFKKRREKYCDDLVDLYCKGDTYDFKTESSVKSRINDLLGKPTEAQTKKLNEFKESHSESAAL